MLPAVSRVLETALLQEVGRGPGSIVPRDSLTLPVPQQGWTAASPLGAAFPPSRMPGPPVLSATHLPFPMGSRNLKAQGPMMVKPGPARQVGGGVGGPQHRRPPHPYSWGTQVGGFGASWPLYSLPRQAHSSPVGPLFLSSDAGSGQALPHLHHPQSKVASGLFTEGLRPYPFPQRRPNHDHLNTPPRLPGPDPAGGCLAPASPTLRACVPDESASHRPAALALVSASHQLPLPTNGPQKVPRPRILHLSECIRFPGSSSQRPMGSRAQLS